MKNIFNFNITEETFYSLNNNISNSSEYGGNTLNNIAEGKSYPTCYLQLINYFRIIKEIQKNDIILDVGCGQAELMTVMRNNYLGNYYIGIEVNDYNLKKCKGLFIKSKREILIKQDVTVGLPIIDDSIDVITCNFLLEHLPKDKSFFVFKELVRVCKKQGLILICMPYRKNTNDKNGEEKHIYEWTKEDIYEQIKINNVSLEESYLAGAKLQDLKKDNKLKEIINCLQGKVDSMFIRTVLSPLSRGEGRDIYCKIRKGNLCL